jgi:DNA-binding transcriptional MerR regulator
MTAGGILVPGFKDRFTGYRYYTVDQIETALKIKTLCSLGFGLSEIAKIMSATEKSDDDAVFEIILKKHSETIAKIRRLEKIASLLKEKRDFSELFKINVSEPVIKDVAAIRVISGRKTGTYEEVCLKVADDLMEIIFSPENQRNGVKITGLCMSICYDNKYRENNADIEMAVPVQGPVVSDNPDYFVRTIMHAGQSH